MRSGARIAALLVWGMLGNSCGSTASSGDLPAASAQAQSVATPSVDTTPTAAATIATPSPQSDPPARLPTAREDSTCDDVESSEAMECPVVWHLDGIDYGTSAQLPGPPPAHRSEAVAYAPGFPDEPTIFELLGDSLENGLMFVHPSGDFHVLLTPLGT